MTRFGSRRSGDRTWLVALAASLWVLSALLREPLAHEMPTLSLVLMEHLVLVLLLSPWLVPSTRALAASSLRTKLAVVVIGAGSSALATVMFTAAFRIGDPITPQVLQKLQPLVALVLAAVILGERLSRRYPAFAVPAIAGAWLLTFPDPFDVAVQGLVAALLAVGAAGLWAAGTVLGRLATAELSFLHVTTLRFAVGLVTLTLFAALVGPPIQVPRELIPRLVLLALIPGLLALTLYYLALQRTPAARATIAELTFPVTAAAVGVAFLDGRLDASQWLGFAVVLTSVVALSLHEQRAEKPVVTTAAFAPDALSAARGPS
jgi:drug/metabolite transporter (DMT)-like permease